MKLKITVLLICLLAGAVTSQTLAQTDNRAYQGWTEVYWGTWVFCDGEIIDIIEGVMKVHYVYKWKDGWWEIDQTHGTGTSRVTGEVFTYQEIGKILYSEDFLSWQFNAIGDEGSHYIGRIEADASETPWILTSIRAVCK